MNGIDRDALIGMANEALLPSADRCITPDRCLFGSPDRIVDAILPAVEQAIRAAEQRGREQALAKKPQRQCSLTEQLSELRLLAVREGLYDADDWLMETLNAERPPEIPMISAAEHAYNQASGRLARGGSTDEEQT